MTAAARNQDRYPCKTHRPLRSKIIRDLQNERVTPQNNFVVFFASIRIEKRPSFSCKCEKHVMFGVTDRHAFDLGSVVPLLWAFWL